MVDRWCLLAAFSLSAACATAQDTTPSRVVRIIGTYDPRDKFGIVVLPVAGALGDSVRAIIQRDLDFGDRFTVIATDSVDPGPLQSTGTTAGLNYPLFARLAASRVVQITPVAIGLHVVLHDVGETQVVNVAEMTLPSSGLGRDWRMAVHRISDEIERWVTGRPGIAATRIAYVRGRGLTASMRLIDSDGASEITIPVGDCGVSPAWNPTGTALAYATCGADSRIHVLDLATGESRTIIGPTRNMSYISPAFSRDGGLIAYARAGGDHTDIFVTSATGSSAPSRLTAARGFDNTNPTFSPDGRRIAYVSGVLGHPEVYLMQADGTDAEALTDYADVGGKSYRSDPDWSSDGQFVAYQERIDNRFQISTIRAAGGAPKPLTNDGENEQPSWAPDARHLVFTSTRTGTQQLWIVDAESGRLRQLTKSAGSRLAAWSQRFR